MQRCLSKRSFPFKLVEIGRGGVASTKICILCVVMPSSFAEYVDVTTESLIYAQRMPNDRNFVDI